jgi:hypothetical protein
LEQGVWAGRQVGGSQYTPATTEEAKRRAGERGWTDNVLWLFGTPVSLVGLPSMLEEGEAGRWGVTTTGDFLAATPSELPRCEVDGQPCCLPHPT